MAQRSPFSSNLPGKLYKQVTRAESRTFDGPFRARRGEVLITADWRIRCAKSCGPLTKLAARDLRRTLKDAFGVTSKASEHVIHVDVVGKESTGAETSQIKVSDDEVLIEAATDEAAMRALFDIRWQMLNRQSPVLSIGEAEVKPAWPVRIFSPVWHRPIDQPEDYLELPKAYLLNAARYGYNATYLFVDWLDFMSPGAAGKLARKGHKQRIESLRQAAAYLGEFGIQLHLHINTMAMPADHPLFQSSPELRGAQTWRDGEHCICSSHPKALALYEQAAKQLFTDVPELAGAVLITGGECFLHCYTRPMPQTDKGTNCKRCARSSADKVIAGAVNAFTKGALKAKDDARIMMWPYSAFTWGDVPTQQKLVEQLHPSVNLLASFEKDDVQTIDGIDSYIFDYSISRLGPSPRFEKLRRTAKKQDRDVLVRTESAQCIELFSVPRIPIMHRWAERFKGIRDQDVAGVHTAWRFYGFCAQRNDELVYAANWNRDFDIDACLKTIAKRDFGNSAASAMVRAWRCFSDAFAAFPYCAGVTGFPYFRGPFYLGPAHPFVFDTTANNDVPADFWRVNPAAAEAAGSSKRVLRREPRFFVDLTWTQPFGAERVAGALKTVHANWTKGMQAIDRAMQSKDVLHEAVADERNIAQMIHCIITTAKHLIAFHQLRENVTTHGSTPAILRTTCRDAIAIVQDEITNAECALKLTTEDARLGYGATYGYAYTPELIEQKIEQCQSQIRKAIPAFFDTHAFHCFGMRDRSL